MIWTRSRPAFGRSRSPVAIRLRQDPSSRVTGHRIRRPTSASRRKSILAAAHARTMHARTIQRWHGYTLSRQLSTHLLKHKLKPLRPSRRCAGTPHPPRLTGCRPPRVQRERRGGKYCRRLRRARPCPARCYSRGARGVRRRTSSRLLGASTFRGRPSPPARFPATRNAGGRACASRATRAPPWSPPRPSPSWGRGCTADCATRDASISRSPSPSTRRCPSSSSPSRPTSARAKRDGRGTLPSELTREIPSASAAKD